MGRPEHIMAVGGQQGASIQTTEQGSIQTNNYPHGGAFSHDGSNYPYTLDAGSEGINLLQAIHLTTAGDIVMEVTNEAGETFKVPLNSTIGEWSDWEMSKVVFRDPNGTAADLDGSWAGE